MSLRSQLITKEFPELDRVERLNNEAFPEEERIPLSEFLQLDGHDDYHFFAFYDEDDLRHRTSNEESWLRKWDYW